MIWSPALQMQNGLLCDDEDDRDSSSTTCSKDQPTAKAKLHNQRQN